MKVPASMELTFLLGKMDRQLIALSLKPDESFQLIKSLSNDWKESIDFGVKWVVGCFGKIDESWIAVQGGGGGRATIDSGELWLEVR